MRLVGSLTNAKEKPNKPETRFTAAILRSATTCENQVIVQRMKMV